MAQKKITLKDIAKELGVSISTVSKALKNSEEIGTDTKSRITAFAKAHNYKPNNIALSLKNRRTKNIAVIIPDIVHHFFTTVVRGIEKYANSCGYNVVVCVSNENFEKEVINIEMLANGSIDGFLLSLSAETEQKNDFNHLQELVLQDIPLVLFDRVTDEVPCDKVVMDDILGGYLATRKLILEGRKRIAFLTTEDFFSVSRNRFIGFKKALEETGEKVNPNMVLKLPFMNLEKEPITSFLMNQKPDAVLSVNEIFGVYAQKVLQGMELNIPEQVSVIGFTDGLLAQHANPSITSIAQHGEQMGEQAAKYLIERIEAETEFTHTRVKIIEPTLILRESTLGE